MNNGWPGAWVSGKEKKMRDESDVDDMTLVNDMGTILLRGGGPEEYLWIGGDLPENIC